MKRDSGPQALDMVAPAVGFALVFLLLRAANQTPDGLSYALAVRTGVDMFHPHHLLYVPVARLVHQAFGVGPITATLLENLFWVPVLAWSAWRLAARILPGRLGPVLAAAGLLSLRGVMIYAVRVEVYLPALACLALATVLAVERPVRSWFLALVLALAIGYHQTNVLFAVPLVFLLVGSRPGAAVRTGASLSAAALLVVGAYWAAARQAGEGFWAFALDYARAPIAAWGSFDYYSLGGLGQLAASQMKMILPVRQSAAAFGALVFGAVLVFLAVWHAVRIRRADDHASLRRFGLVFLAVYYLFFLWWMPSDADFFVATLLPLWLLAVILVRDLASQRRFGLPALVMIAALALGNIFFTILPMHRDPGPGRNLALALDRAAPPDAEIVAGYAVQQEMLYFTDRTRVHEGDGLARSVRDGRPPRAWSPPVVIDGLLLRELLARGDTRTEAYLKWLLDFDAGYRSALAVRRLPDTDALVLGPDRSPVDSWAAVVEMIRELSGPGKS